MKLGRSSFSPDKKHTDTIAGDDDDDDDAINSSKIGIKGLH